MSATRHSFNHITFHSQMSFSSLQPVIDSQFGLIFSSGTCEPD